MKYDELKETGYYWRTDEKSREVVEVEQNSDGTEFHIWFIGCECENTGFFERVIGAEFDGPFAKRELFID